MAAGDPARRLRGAWLWACSLDVEVAKPGNVSRGSPGHGMQAAQFIASAEASADAVAGEGPVGAGIEAAIRATRAAVGCNTNLGIVLLCVPLARAWRRGGESGSEGLGRALAEVLATLDVEDARAAYRAIALAAPGGLGRAPAQDVAAPPEVSLRDAMVLAAGRDRIARQYRDGFRDILSSGLRELADAAAARVTLADAVQGLFVRFLAEWPDSHIVRKLGAGVAQSVTAEARGWRRRFRTDPAAGRHADFAIWDKSLKSRAINPGTTADMTVATLFAAALVDPESLRCAARDAWHGNCMSPRRIGS